MIITFTISQSINQFKGDILMNKLLLLTIIIIILSTCSQEEFEELVFVEGETFINTKSNYYGKNVTIQDFYIGKYEVTQKEWVEVTGNNPSQFKGDDLPIETVSWYDCVEYCNKRSIKEGLEPYYNIDRDTKDPNITDDLDDIRWTVTINADANGYRLPTEAEWEYASGGGQKSKSYTYSGSENIDEVGYYWKNSGDKYLTGNWNWSALQANNSSTQPVGNLKPNELGLYDMSGNVREWCWNWYDSGGTDLYQGRIIRGGGWVGGGKYCSSFDRDASNANRMSPDLGFRVCRSVYPDNNQKSN